ncbi:glycosyltransferase family 2 protein [Isoptericola sp. NEAU-Y5]|uniref:Glycosyltransferase family 2 protein n=1 Tax=Isoptericola luteus TaxID=2879484 RepID=A0ABS7ZFV3_9MICO|nr:glycosyltransferase family A protein [Isoptericola sp. NEAU-Y5]MCA5892729.1 glycosyltransferase family 2 protein [Isoptericola sp. NEAU-Y5]
MSHPLDSTLRTDQDVVLTAARHFAQDVETGAARAATAALDMKSVSAREVIARMIDPHSDYATLVSGAADPTGSLISGPGGEPIGRLLTALARTVAHQRLLEDDLGDALKLFRDARRHMRVEDWERQDVITFAQTLWIGGGQEALKSDEELLAALPRETQKFLRIDLHGIERGVGSDSWLELLNNYLVDHGVTPIALGPATAAPTTFDRLRPGETSVAASGPLITVVMPAFRPGREIVTAVRSIVDQSWQDWELLVVDDASGPEFGAVFDEVEAMDQRVRVLRQPVNLGTYAARNRALDESSGEFITCQDIDDWSHPERLERQVRPLLEDPRLLRTLSRSMRCSDDLVFQYPGYPSSRSNASSHLFRRTVLDTVGRFDWVRKGGDTEFDWRLEAAFPGRRLQVREPLAFVRLQPESLSRGDFTPEWMHPARVEYRASVLHWHRQITAGTASPLIPPDVADRPLTAPRPFLPDRGASQRPVDIAFVADWTMNGAAHRAALDEMRLLARAGAHVGIVNVRSIFSEAPRRAELTIETRRALAAGTLTSVSLEESDHIPTIVVRQPEVLEFPPLRPVRLTTDQVLVVADSVPEEGVRDRRWTVSDVDRHAQAIFGGPVTWMAPGDETRRSMSRQIEADRLSDVPYPVVLDLDAWPSVGPRQLRGERAVVGWISGHDATSVPADETNLLRALPTDGSVDVRVLGGRAAVSRTLDSLPPHWLVYETGELSARAFAQQIDFMVGFPPSGPTSETLRTVSEGLAAGCVTVVDRSFEPYFGDAVIGCEPESAPAVVDALRADPAAFRAQSDRGMQWAADRFSSSGALLAAVLGTAKPARAVPA